jgi:hypothetical protein
MATDPKSTTRDPSAAAPDRSNGARRSGGSDATGKANGNKGGSDRTAPGRTPKTGEKK